jgi:hypothetical protein
VPTAGGHSAENRTARGRLIEVEGLRVELCRERKGPLLFDTQPP